MHKTYYTDQELKEFKVLIEKKLTKAKQEYKLLMEYVSRDNNGTDDTCRSSNLLEDGSDTLSREEHNILAQKQLKFIESLKGALIRVGNGSYGVCVVTGEIIPKERLMAVPGTTTTIKQKIN